MNKVILFVMSIVLIMSFSACSSSSNAGSNDDYQELESKSISNIVVYDLDGNTIEDAEVSIVKKSNSRQAISLPSGYGSGEYTLTITLDGESYSIDLTIDEDNSQELASVLIPASKPQGSSTYTKVDAIAGSVSGLVLDKNNSPIANAQVSISAGASTNGAYATAISDENGYYELLINVSTTLASDILNSTISATADNYLVKSLDFSMEAGKNSTGINFNLSSNTLSSIKEFDFESDTSSWTVTKLSGANANTTWSVHQKGTSTTNKAFTDNNVVLAPNDTTAGKVAEPISGNSCFWYGNKVTSDAAYGSFIGSADAEELSGGTSSSDNSAELVSPTIDLSQVSGSINLSFKTWWEIESVNPNSGGFDLMTISISDDGGTTWRKLARLNPLSDPNTELERDSIPFSNLGFNSAPKWTIQEPISLEDETGVSYAGKNIKVKFTFETVDESFNGFRGWMIDDVSINSGAGTFPLFDESFTQAAPALQRRTR